MSYPPNKRETSCNLMSEDVRIRAVTIMIWRSCLPEKFALNIRLPRANKQELSKLHERKRGFSMRFSVFIPGYLHKVRAKNIISGDVIIES